MDQQELKRLQAWNRIVSHAADIDATLPSDDKLVIRLGLICTVYFLNGGQPAVREKILTCFDRFYAEFGPHLQGQFSSGMGRFSGLKKDSFNLRRSHISARDPSSDGGMSWCVQSEKKGTHGPEYAIKTLATMTGNDEYGVLSYLKIILPWKLLDTEEGQACYMRWVHYLTDTFEVQHGYGGLSPILPHDRHAYQPYELNLAEQFSGLMLDSSPHLDKSDLKKHIKGINWLTILGPRFVAKLGNEEILRQQLELADDVSVSKTAGGCLIVQAGVLPELGAPEHGLPPAYVAVNRVIKPIRVPNPDQLHTHMDDAIGFTEDKTLAWYARFDTPDSPFDLSAPTLAPLTEMARVEANQTCQQSGYWYTPAKQNSRALFKQGELMPDFPDSSYGATIWYWDADQN